MRKSNVEHNNLLRKIIITTNCFEYNFLSKKIIFQHDHQLDLSRKKNDITSNYNN